MGELHSSHTYKELSKVGEEGWFEPKEFARLEIFSEITATMHAMRVNQGDPANSYFLYATSASGKLLAGQHGYASNIDSAIADLKRMLRQLGEELHMYAVSFYHAFEERRPNGETDQALVVFEESRIHRARAVFRPLLSTEERIAKGRTIDPRAPRLFLDTWRDMASDGGQDGGWYLLNDKDGKPVPAVEKETCVRFTPNQDWRTANALGQFAGLSRSPRSSPSRLRRRRHWKRTSGRRCSLPPRDLFAIASPPKPNWPGALPMVVRLMWCNRKCAAPPRRRRHTMS